MKKKNFITLVLGTLAGLLLSIGMCCVLLPEWDAFRPGIALGAAGGILALVLLGVRRRMAGKPFLRIRARSLGIAALGTVGTLVLGGGLCLVLLWSQLLAGILVGTLGILLLLFLIPAVRGWR